MARWRQPLRGSHKSHETPGHEAQRGRHGSATRRLITSSREEGGTDRPAHRRPSSVGLGRVGLGSGPPDCRHRALRITCAESLPRRTLEHNCIVRCRIGRNQSAKWTKFPALASRPAPLTPIHPTTPRRLFIDTEDRSERRHRRRRRRSRSEQGPGHYPGTPLPGEPGNVAIAGHRTTYAHPLQPRPTGRWRSDFHHDEPRTLRYNVSGTQIVPPTDVAVLDTTSSAATLTLTTCNPRYSAATRMVVTADFVPGPNKGAKREERARPRAPRTQSSGHRLRRALPAIP